MRIGYVKSGSWQMIQPVVVRVDADRNQQIEFWKPTAEPSKCEDAAEGSVTVFLSLLLLLVLTLLLGLLESARVQTARVQCVAALATRGCSVSFRNMTEICWNSMRYSFCQVEARGHSTRKHWAARSDSMRRLVSAKNNPAAIQAFMLEQ